MKNPSFKSLKLTFFWLYFQTITDTIRDVTLIAHIQDNAFEIEHLNGVTNDKVLSQALIKYLFLILELLNYRMQKHTFKFSPPKKND